MTPIKNLSLLTTKLKKLIIYRDFLEDQLIKKILKIIKQLKTDSSNSPELIDDYYYLYSQLIEFGVNKKINGNLWQSYLLNKLLTAKNIFTLSSERLGSKLGSSLQQAALHDLKIIQELYHLDLNSLAELLATEPPKLIQNFTPVETEKKSTQALEQLHKNFKQGAIKQLSKELIDYYHQQGAAKLNQYKAFRWSSKQGLVGINNPDPIEFSDLIGYHQQQKKLIENTQIFLNKQRANNVLLIGASGTGKSSSVKALVNKFAQAGLRLLEINKQQLRELPQILELLKKRGLYFIIFMDDLSFEDFETEYKYLKAIMEGGSEVKPKNVLFYATSNRRNLIKEKWSDRDPESGEIHPGDGREERHSLVERFGLTIRYQSPDQQEYLKIIEKLAAKEQLPIAKEKLREEALQWELWNNGRSGRTAQQFINHLKGRLALQNSKT
ncbi:ATP-binding protein [Fuchsiella alkaliacetigena]|uniref:ATP-binding protein n=1 Tax=Fuchsiella alkaliacetigena TaxID=957042 RepID=UPI00200B2446|nr:ATP-binding protein [Fuchsiella alkaliacetigena]MCK8826057.1 ATP-binding protein [Fuchsiella alkaliacetigena]